MRVAVVTLGCPKNEVDSWIMRGHLAASGYDVVPPDEAEVVIVNTCGFIREAKEESIDTILGFLEAKKRVFVAGCLYQRYGAELVESLPEVEGWISLGEVRRVAEILGGAPSRITPAVLPRAEDFRPIRPSSFVYVKVSEGCNNRCHYCAIPSIRGPLRSRRVEDVLEEVVFWLDRGAKEVILISQDTTSYGADLGVKHGLLNLLEAIEKIEGDFWVRVLYMHPAGVDRALLEFIRDSSRVVNYVDVPMQHVSERVLGLMGRRGGKEAVLKVADLVNELGLYLRTTFLVGHPGEDEKDFEELVEFVEELNPWRFSVFAYSPEEGTVSFGMEPVPSEVAAERASVLHRLQFDMAFSNNLTFVGRRLRVLVDEPGRARFFALAPDIDGDVVVKGSLPVGEWAEVVVRDAVGVDLEAEPVSVSGQLG